MPARAAPTTQSSQIPNGSAPLGALAPDNLHRVRPAAPFDLTGTWFIDLSNGFDSWKFGPPYPRFKPHAQSELDAATAAERSGHGYKDYIGQCYPPGLPTIMTRVWPIAMIQLPTAIYMISGFENSLRIIYLDGRPHLDPDVVVRSWNGESVGHWDGDALIVDTKYFISDKHTIDVGIPVSDDFHVIVRITMSRDRKHLQFRYEMWDPKMWQGEWDSEKVWNRTDDMDITEVECTPDLNKHLPSTQSKLNIK
jgi:hypothetical protein